MLLRCFLLCFPERCVTKWCGGDVTLFPPEIHGEGGVLFFLGSYVALHFPAPYSVKISCFVSRICPENHSRYSCEFSPCIKPENRRVRCVNPITPSRSLCKYCVNYIPITRERSRLHSLHIKIEPNFTA